ncbi:hypothetical protein BY996DRAFT_7145519 [Phakopsora pachyrhizi]|nr:hypothetical protein BY996DRAFT_7145519 [Phakopsora pachyrhizi]
MRMIMIIMTITMFTIVFWIRKLLKVLSYWITGSIRKFNVHGRAYKVIFFFFLNSGQILVCRPKVDK